MTNCTVFVFVSLVFPYFTFYCLFVGFDSHFLVKCASLFLFLCLWLFPLVDILLKVKVAPLHTMEALWVRGGITPTLS
jgi:hypothetical protein